MFDRWVRSGRAWAALLGAWAVLSRQGEAVAQVSADRDTTRADTVRYELAGLEVVGRRQSLATTTFMRERLESQAAGLNALDVVNRSPSFVFSAGDAHGFYEYGQNVQLRVFNLQQLAMTVDGVPLGSQAPAGGSPVGRFVENESVERVTVNQGSGSIENLSSVGLGGAVVYETTQPDAEAGGYLRVTGATSVPAELTPSTTRVISARAHVRT